MLLAFWIQVANRIKSKTIHWSLLNIDIVWILYAFIGSDWANRHWKQEEKNRQQQLVAVVCMCVRHVHGLMSNEYMGVGVSIKCV